MSTKPTVIVAGLGRCGSSLTMQILAAGGLPCLGSFPDFEDMRTNQPPSLELIAAQAGGAMKVLDPHRNRIPHSADCVVIWLDRNLQQQARSQAKMLHHAIGMPALNRRQTRAMEATLQRDRALARASLNPAWPLLRLTFEELVRAPEDALRRIAAFLPHFRLTASALACVVPRSALCQRDMRIEQQLLEQAEAA